MTISRRDSLKYLALAASGAALGTPFAGPVQASEPSSAPTGPKRFVFLLVTNGFHPAHVRPSNLGDAAPTDRLADLDLTSLQLPEYSAPLDRYKSRMTIVQGVNGVHCEPGHGSPYGCLAGVKKRHSPSAQTIDHALAQVLPQTPLPMLGIGLGQLRTMQNQSITYSSSAAGAARPIPMFSDPRVLYQNVFGCVAGGATQEAFLAETDWYAQLIDDSDRLRRRLAGEEAARFDTYINGLRQMRSQRLALMERRDSLSQYKPTVTEAFNNAQHSGDWWDASIDVGMAALRAGVTNVVTIDAGMSSPDETPMDTLASLLKSEGRGNGQNLPDSHHFGHISQTDSDGRWLTMRHYTWRVLERIIQPLATTPEPNGKGSMLDNTLIVYTSDSAEVQHSHGYQWPFVLIGNLGGRIRSGRYIQLPHWGSAVRRPRPEDGRSINALWTTLLHAAGAKVDSFNLDKALSGIDRPGPMEELLA